MKRKMWTYAAAAAGMALTMGAFIPYDASASTAPGASSTGTLSVGLSAEPVLLDPAMSTALVDRQVMINIYDTLLQLGPHSRILPDLVTSYTVSKNGLTYTLHLRHGVKFQDGTPFDASAVKFNLERDMQKSSPRHAELTAVQSVQTAGNYTVVLHLKQPFGPLVAVLTGRSGMMVSPAAVRKEGSAFTRNPVGTGPYEFKDWVKGNHITLVKNPHYWQSNIPYFPKVVFKFFADPNVEYMNLQSGAVQVVDTVPAQDMAALKQNSNFTVINQPSYGYQGIWLNVRSAPFNNLYLRQAVNLAINRQTIVNVLLKGTAVPGYSPFGPASPAYLRAENTPPTPNGAAVKRLLKEGGKPGGFAFTMKIANSPITAEMAQIIQSMLGQYGIKMNIQQLEFGTLLSQAESHNFQSLQLGWSGRLDPDENIYSFFSTGGPMNWSNFSNARVDSLLNLARRESTAAERRQTYAQVMNLLHAQVPYVFLYNPNNVLAYSSKLKGFEYVPDGLIRAYTLSDK